MSSRPHLTVSSGNPASSAHSAFLWNWGGTAQSSTARTRWRLPTLSSAAATSFRDLLPSTPRTSGAASPRSHRDDRPLSRAAHGVFSESANAAYWLGGFVATPLEDKTAPRERPSERSGVGRGDYLIRTFLLRAVAAFGTWTVKIPS